MDFPQTTFPLDFYFFTPYVYTPITTTFQGKHINFVPCQNGGQITDFLRYFNFRENLKQTNQQNKQTNTFPKEFSNEIWFKLGDHEYINIADIKFV